jgi:hypothetical protein
MTFEEVLPALKRGEKITLEFARDTCFHYFLAKAPALLGLGEFSGSKIMVSSADGRIDDAGWNFIGIDILRDDWIILT